MADSIKDKVQELGHSAAETAKQVGNRVSEATEKATDWAKEKAHVVGNRIDETAQKVKHTIQENVGSSSSRDTSCGKTGAEIQERMDVIGSCGNKLGVVDHVEGNSIKLTRKDSPDGQHHFVPLSWVHHVDAHVHLNKNCGAAKTEWTTEA